MPRLSVLPDVSCAPGGEAPTAGTGYFTPGRANSPRRGFKAVTTACAPGHRDDARRLARTAIIAIIPMHAAAGRSLLAAFCLTVPVHASPQTLPAGPI
ncbi:MAG: hypothetical protein LC753_20540, partial [Acidobacteria bacterium]|nr:hypothetical protein [Acidobacteriota bacterium]